MNPKSSGSPLTPSCAIQRLKHCFVDLIYWLKSLCRHSWSIEDKSTWVLSGSDHCLVDMSCSIKHDNSISNYNGTGHIQFPEDVSPWFIYPLSVTLRLPVCHHYSTKHLNVFYRLVQDAVGAAMAPQRIYPFSIFVVLMPDFFFRDQGFFLLCISIFLLGEFEQNDNFVNVFIVLWRWTLMVLDVELIFFQCLQWVLLMSAYAWMLDTARYCLDIHALQRMNPKQIW